MWACATHSSLTNVMFCLMLPTGVPLFVAPWRADTSKTPLELLADTVNGQFRPLELVSFMITA